MGKWLAGNGGMSVEKDKWKKLWIVSPSDDELDTLVRTESLSGKTVDEWAALAREAEPLYGSDRPRTRADDRRAATLVREAQRLRDELYSLAVEALVREAAK